MRPPVVVVTGLGVVSPVGVTREAFFAGLAAGSTGIRALPEPINLSSGVTHAARIEDVGARRYYEPRALRRMARATVMALVAAREAVDDAKLGASTSGARPYASERTGIVFGTGLGALQETFDFIRGYVKEGPEAASPMLFPSSVMNAAAGQLAIELGLRGANSTINHRDASPFDALRMACDLLALGRADALLVGAVDEVSATSLAAYHHLARLAPAGMRPYARDRDGTVPGEGAAVLVLEREDDARRRGAPVLARIAGLTSSGGSRPRVGWGDGWHNAADTIRAALDEAGCAPARIDYVAGGGCGLAVDGLEARAVTSVLGDAAPLGSILGQTGEFLSAGILRVAAAIYALSQQALPGTVGAGETDAALPLPGLVRRPHAARVEAVLVPSLAQGGADAALVLTR